MKSIHRYLLLSLIAALSVGTLLVALFLYGKSAAEINELYDSNMKSLAHVVDAQFSASTSTGFFRSESNAHMQHGAIFEEEDFLIQVWDAAGKLVYTTHPLIRFPPAGKT